MSAADNPALSSRSYASRRRILEVAHAELIRDPHASMDHIARAAGVARRTLYGHFSSRDALITALTEVAIEEVAQAFSEDLADPTIPADQALARGTLAGWKHADRYRLLVSLAQQSVTDQGIRARMEPVRRKASAVLARGLADGAFQSPLTPRALAHVYEHTLFGLLQAINDGDLRADAAGPGAALTVLLATGVPYARAEEAVRNAQRALRSGGAGRPTEGGELRLARRTEAADGPSGGRRSERRSAWPGRAPLTHQDAERQRRREAAVEHRRGAGDDDNGRPEGTPTFADPA